MTRLSLTDPLAVILGGRVSWYKHRSVSHEPGVPSSSYQEKGVFTPYAGIVYDLDNNWSVYASYTDIFQPQTNVDASGQTLDPILGNNYEIGIKGMCLTGGRTRRFRFSAVRQRTVPFSMMTIIHVLLPQPANAPLREEKSEAKVLSSN